MQSINQQIMTTSLKADHRPIITFGTLPPLGMVAPAAEAEEESAHASDTLVALLLAAEGSFELDAEAKVFTPAAKAQEEWVKPRPKPARKKAAPPALSKTIAHHGFKGSVIGKAGSVIKALEAKHRAQIKLVGDSFVVKAKSIEHVESAATEVARIIAQCQEERRIWRMSSGKAQEELALHKQLQALKKKLQKVSALKRQHTEGRSIEANQWHMLEPEYEQDLVARLGSVQGKLTTSQSAVPALKAKALRREH